jgi:hypothetical protein
MYIHQDRNQVKIGYSGYGNLGQVPKNTITLTVGSKQISLTGPANEIGVAASVVSMLNSAVSGAKKGQTIEANAVLAKARGMLPATGSLRSQVEPLVAAAEREISAVPVFSAPTKKGISPLLVVGGLGTVIAVVVFLRRKRA